MITSPRDVIGSHFNYLESVVLTIDYAYGFDAACASALLVDVNVDGVHFTVGNRNEIEQLIRHDTSLPDDALKGYLRILEHPANFGPVVLVDIRDGEDITCGGGALLSYRSSAKHYEQKTPTYTMAVGSRILLGSPVRQPGAVLS